MEKYSKEYEKLICDTYLELKTVSAVSRKLKISRTYVARMIEAYGLKKKKRLRFNRFN